MNTARYFSFISTHNVGGRCEGEGVGGEGRGMVVGGREEWREGVTVPISNEVGVLCYNTFELLTF